MKKILSVFLVILCVSGMRAQAVWGTTGLLRMPTAEMQKDKTFMFGGNILDKHPMPPRWNNESYTYTYNYYIGITIFPWLEVAYSCTLVKGRKQESSYWPEETWGKFVNQDRNFSARLRLWKEGWWKSWTPQIVLGVNDPGSFDSYGGGSISLDQNGNTSHHFNRYYIAATKHLNFEGVGCLGGHVAYCYSIKSASLRYVGPAVGANFRFQLSETSFINKAVNGLNLMAEYDSRTVNCGFEYSFWKDYINAVVELNRCKYFSGGLIFKVHLK